MTFDERVFDLVSHIPKGKVATYQSIAYALGINSPRAVGQALKRNPHPISVPCHRVVHTDGRVGGYSGVPNSTQKEALLRKEGVSITQGWIDLKKFGWNAF